MPCREHCLRQRSNLAGGQPDFSLSSHQAVSPNAAGLPPRERPVGCETPPMTTLCDCELSGNCYKLTHSRYSLLEVVSFDGCGRSYALATVCHGPSHCLTDTSV